MAFKEDMLNRELTGEIKKGAADYREKRIQMLIGTSGFASLFCKALKFKIRWRVTELGTN